MKKSNLIRIQTKNNLIILTHKTDTLITLIIFLKKYEKSNLIRIQTKDNLIIFTHKINTLITPVTFLKKCEKDQMSFLFGSVYFFW